MNLQRLTLWLLFGWAFSPTLIATRAAGAASVSAEEVLRQALAARGGRGAFLNLRSFQAKGTVSFYTCSGPWWGAPSLTNIWPLEILATRSNQFRFVTDLTSTAGASSVFVPPRYYENGSDGQTAWEAPPGNPPQALDGILGEERREQAQCFAWCAEAQNYRSVTNLGDTDFEGRRCYELKLVRKSGNEETHYYDASNHLLAGIVRSSVFGPSLERFLFGHYREVGGFQFPTRIVYRADDERYEAHLSAVEQLDSIEVNCVKDSAFTRPREGARFPPPKGPPPRQLTDEIQPVLRDWVDADKLATGIVVGLLDEQGRQLIHYGKRENQFCLFQKGKHRFGVITTHPKAKGDTVFLIASITKVFTRLLLLDMVQRGDMRLDDPAQLYLPASVRLPSRNGKPITLLHLATHTSGLPAWVGSDGGSLEKIYADLSKYQLSRAPGAAYEYSNIGMGLLGIAIERKAGKPYRSLLAERICRPLGMNHTSVLRCEYPGAGAIQSTAEDMLKFASACLGLAPPPSPLASLMQHEYATHGGNGGGCASQLVLDHAHRRALVTLCNTVDGRYFHAGAALQRLILNPLKPSAVAKIKDPVCDDYAGQYLLDKTSVSVCRSGHRLLLQETNRPSCELFPTSQTEFMNCLFGLRATFTPGAPGQPVRLTLHNLEQNSSAAGCKTSSPVPRDAPH